MQVTITNNTDIDISVSNDVDIDLSVDDNSFDIGKLPDTYTGEHVVTPAFIEQVLETAHKQLKRDVHVLEIPVSTVSNIYGGETVTIG